MRTRTAVKPFMCTQCNKSFSHSGDVKVHIRTHTREKPFMYTQSISQSDDLKKYMRLHTGEKSLVCTECNKSFWFQITWRCTWELIQERNPLLAHCAISHFLGQMSWRCTWELTLERIPLSAQSAISHFLSQIPWRCTCKPTLESKPFECTECYESFSHIIWTITWEHNLGRNALCAQSVISHVCTQLTWRCTLELTVDKFFWVMICQKILMVHKMSFKTCLQMETWKKN
jgi:protein-arginine kinase activator protein McsA